MSSLIPDLCLPTAEALVYPPIEPLGNAGSSFLLNEFEEDFLQEFPEFLSEAIYTPKADLMDRILHSLQ